MVLVLCCFTGSCCTFPSDNARAAAGQRTKQTVGRLRRTLHGSEVHNCLVIICRPGFIEHLTRQSGKSLFPFSRINGNINAEIAGKHPIHISRRPPHKACHRQRSRWPLPYNPHSLKARTLHRFRKCPLHAFWLRHAGCGHANSTPGPANISSLRPRTQQPATPHPGKRFYETQKNTHTPCATLVCCKMISEIHIR